MKISLTSQEATFTRPEAKYSLARVNRFTKPRKENQSSIFHKGFSQGPVILATQSPATTRFDLLALSFQVSSLHSPLLAFSNSTHSNIPSL